MNILKIIARIILKEELDKTEQLIIDQQSNIEQLENRNEELSQSEKLIKQYPSKEVYYKGRYLPMSNKPIPAPVNVLITPNDPKIIADLTKWNLLNSTEDKETLIPKIYRKVMETYFLYAYDKDVWNGLNEVWEIPFELFAKFPTGKIKGDCDSFSILLVSYLRAAGIPPGYVWVVVGDCKVSGHATVYCYSKKTNKFHHLNSTAQIYKPNVSDYPTHEDARQGKDDYGIYAVWVSFNDVVARTEFKPNEIKQFIIKELNQGGSVK